MSHTLIASFGRVDAASCFISTSNNWGHTDTKTDTAPPEFPTGVCCSPESVDRPTRDF